MTARLRLSLDRLLFLGLFAGCFVLPTTVAAQDPPAPAESFQEYRIGVGDVVVSAIWKSPDLTVTVPVRPDGKIGFPLIGEIVVASRTPAELQEVLTREYAKFVTAPEVSVVIEEIQSRKVFVLGEVNRPGVYDILRPIRLLQVLARAGGMTEFARKDEVVVLRQTPAGEERLEVNVKAITTGRRLGDNLILLPGDTVFVP